MTFYLIHDYYDCQSNILIIFWNDHVTSSINTFSWMVPKHTDRLIVSFHVKPTFDGHAPETPLQRQQQLCSLHCFKMEEPHSSDSSRGDEFEPFFGLRVVQGEVPR